MPLSERTKNMLFFAGGVAVGAALPVVVPAVVEGGRPLAKALLKHGTIGVQRLQVLAARAAESVEDLVAEVRAEAVPAAAAAAAASAAGAVETAREPTSDVPPPPPVDKKALS
jgi:hypothetical protein